MRARSAPSAPGRLTGWRAAIVWLVVGADVAIILALLVVPDSSVLVVALVLAVVAAFGVVGAIIVTRMPRNPIGWILLATGTVAAVSISGAAYATESVLSSSGSLPGTVAVAFVAQFDIYPTLGLVGAILPLVFPDGRLPSRRWRPVAAGSVATVSLATVLAATTPGSMGGGGIANPLGIAAFSAVANFLGLAVVALLAIPCVFAVASVIVRYRGSDRLQRQQLKLLGWAGGVFVVLQLVGSSNIGPLADIGWLLEVGAMGLIPIAIGIAVLRYRLYEIDRIISRTISYGAVTGILALVFVGTVLISQTVLSGFFNGNSVAVAASTLLAAALFQPLRRRVQELVDRRFNRARYDAERTVAAFAGRLRDEIALADVDAAIRAVVAQTVAPTAVGLWMREPGPS
jgi:hypothetical protein